jgi:hypothetical protein
MNNKGNVAAAPLAIADGTYLCLLPKTPGEEQEEDDDDDDVLHYVPALPCIEVWKHCGPKYFDVIGIDTTMQVDDDDDDDDEEDTTKDVTSDDDNDILSKMTTIPIRLSDISKCDFRFIHPVNLVTGSSSSSSVVKVSSCCENIITTKERMTTWSNRNNDTCLEICLPSIMTCDDDDEGEHDFNCLVDDDDCNVVYGDTSCINDLSHYRITNKNKVHSNKQSPSSFQVHGGGSCLIADFTGVGGYEQALILPQVVDSSSSSSRIMEGASLNNSTDETVLTQRKHVLHTILANSILTDGSSVFLPRSTEITMETTTTTSPMIENTTFKLLPVSMSQCCQNHNAVSSQSKDIIAADDKLHDKQRNVNDTLTKEDGIDTSMLPKDPAWLEAIEQTITSRLAMQVAKAKQLERSAQVQSDLITKGRETIHRASRLHFTTGGSVEDVPNDPQILRLRYGTRPRAFSDTQKGLSAVIDLELDMYLPNRVGATNELHDFHVSCTLASKLERNVTVDNIRTLSGVVPVFQDGDCITILASASLNELDMNFHAKSNSTSTLDFNIQGLWLDKLQKRQGSVICILRLPLNDILFSPPTSYVPRVGNCIQHEINFTSDGNARLIPNAVFDYRKPQTLNIDVSGSIGLQDGKVWKDFVSKLNSHIGISSFIDLYFIKEDPTLKLVIFASNPAERAAITNLVLQNLPENAKLVEQDPNEAKNVKALLVSLKNEAEAFQKHRMSKGRTATSEMRKEMCSLQSSTDGIASTIKRGWV